MSRRYAGRSGRGLHRRPDFWVCAICGAVIHGRAGTLHLGVLSHCRKHRRRGETARVYEEDSLEDRGLVWRAGPLAIGGMEMVTSLEEARLVLAGQRCTPAAAKMLDLAERERLRSLGLVQEAGGGE